MSTERTASTPRRLRRRLAGLTLAGLALAPLVPLTATPAAAQVRTPPAGVSDEAITAWQIAQQRATEQDELDRQLVAFFATQRVAPVLEHAASALGRPYSRGASGPSAFDCSGFTRWAWQALGVELPHYSGAQWDQTDHIAIEDLQPGDLVFFWGSGGRGDPGHVGLYVGDGQMIHAPGSGRSVRYESIWYWSGATVAAGRVR